MDCSTHFPKAFERPDAARQDRLSALEGQANGETSEVNAGQLEVAVLMRGRAHRAFRRLTGARLEELLSAGGPATRQTSTPPEDADK